MVNPTAAGAARYKPTFRAITEIPNPKTCASFPSSAKVIIDKLDIIGVMNALTVSWKIGFSRSISAMVGENE